MFQVTSIARKLLFENFVYAVKRSIQMDTSLANHTLTILGIYFRKLIIRNY